MTVAELIELLILLPPEQKQLPIMFEGDYADHSIDKIKYQGSAIFLYDSGNI